MTLISPDVQLSSVKSAIPRLSTARCLAPLTYYLPLGPRGPWELFKTGALVSTVFIYTACRTGIATEFPIKTPESSPSTSVPTITTPTSIAQEQIAAIEFERVKNELYELRGAQLEKEVWENVEEAIPLVYEAYCIAFPGCFKLVPPKVEMLSFEEFWARRGPKLTEEEVRLIFATTYPDGTIIFNRGCGIFTNCVEHKEYDLLLFFVQGVLLEEFFHSERIITPLDQTFVYNNKSYTYISGFDFIDPISGEQLPLVEEAASVLISLHVQHKLGIEEPVIISRRYEKMTALLSYRMRIAGLDVPELVKMHRHADFDGLLGQLYPDILDIDQRRRFAIKEFTTNY